MNRKLHCACWSLIVVFQMLSVIHCAEPKTAHWKVTTAEFSLVVGQDLLITQGYEPQIKLWDPSTGKQRASLAGTRGFAAMALSPDERSLAIADHRGIRIIELATQKATFQVARNARRSSGLIAFAQSGKQLYVTTQDLMEVWDLVKRKQVARHAVPGKPIALSPSGRYLAYAARDKVTGVTRASVFDVQTGKSSGPFGEEGAKRVAFSPDEKSLAITSRLDLTLWSLESQVNTRCVWTDSEADAYHHDVVFAPDGKHLAVTICGAESRVDIWSANGTKRVAQLKSSLTSTDEFSDRVQFLPDGKTLVRSQGNEIQVWDVSALLE